MRKKSSKKQVKKTKISSTKMMFLSFILLFIVIEALYMFKSQSSVLSNSLQQDVAGVHTVK